MKDGFGLPPGGYPALQLPELSRRSFLKLLGVAGLAGSIAPATSPLQLPDAPAGIFIPAELPPQALQLLERAFDELGPQGFPFDLAAANVVVLPRRPELLGLVLSDTRLPPRPDGADIALTIDTGQPSRSLLYALVGRSEGELFELTTTLLRADGARLEQRALYARTEGEAVPGPARHASKYLACQPSSHCPDPASEAQVWVERSGWQYGRASAPAWLLGRGSGGRSELQLRYTRCEEYCNSRSSANPRRQRAYGWQSETRSLSLLSAL